MPDVRPLQLADLPAAVDLAHAVGFRPDLGTWTFLFGLGRAWAIDLSPHTLGGTIVLIPFGEPLAMIAMMIVHPAHQRRGFGRALLGAALAAASGPCVALYATDAGEKLYRPMGFVDAGVSRRFEGRPSNGSVGARDGAVRPMQSGDLRGVLALDATAQGAPREALVRSLAGPRRVPCQRCVVDRGSGIEGFGFASVEQGTWRLGPIVAERDDDAERIADHLAERKDRVRIDLEPDEEALVAWAQARGVAEGVSALRMVRGGTLAGRRSASRALAGRATG